jgi:AraC-like DNA-binding protein
LTRVDQVAEGFGVPVRTLQRLFRRYVGAGPKWVLRRYRLQYGAQLLADGRTEDLAALALELGYFDQAHFSHEFAEVIGSVIGLMRVRRASRRSTCMMSGCRSAVGQLVLVRQFPTSIWYSSPVVCVVGVRVRDVVAVIVTDSASVGIEPIAVHWILGPVRWRDPPFELGAQKIAVAEPA